MITFSTNENIKNKLIIFFQYMIVKIIGLWNTYTGICAKKDFRQDLSVDTNM